MDRRDEQSDPTFEPSHWELRETRHSARHTSFTSRAPSVSVCEETGIALSSNITDEEGKRKNNLKTIKSRKNNILFTLKGHFKENLKWKFAE